MSATSPGTDRNAAPFGGRTAQEAVDAALKAAESSAHLNIFISLDSEGARERALLIDSQIAAGEDPGPLAGAPVALKDLIDQEGRVTTAGSSFLRHRADRAASVVTMLEEAGAVIIGRTGLHEFAFGFSSENPWFGPVRNPWNPNTSVGGSSGGSAAAVASGVVPLAIGTDTGGSVRVPAALTGTYGLKTTYGVVPVDGVFPLVPSLDTVGPIAADAITLDIAYQVLAGKQRLHRRPERLRLGIPQPWVESAPMTGDVAHGFDAFIDALRSLGHTVESVAMPRTLPGSWISHYLAAEVLGVHAAFLADGRPYGAEVEARLEAAKAVTAAEKDEADRIRAEVRDDFEAAFAAYDVLLTPTVPALQKVIGVGTIGDIDYRIVLSWFAAIVNHTGRPAVALPLTGGAGVPVSIQIIGHRGGDGHLLDVAHHLEAEDIVGFRLPPPG